LGWVLIGAGGPAAVLLSRMIGAPETGTRRPALAVPALPRLLPASAS